MRWFRSNVQLGARLALIALALQLVLTFGHIDTLALTRSHSTQSLTAAQSDGAGTGGSQNGLADDFCPTCALIQMSAISTPSVAPVLPLPISAEFVTLRPAAQLALDTAAYFQAKARAPPLV